MGNMKKSEFRAALRFARGSCALGILALATSCGSQSYFNKEAAAVKQSATANLDNSAGSNFSALAATPSPSASPSGRIQLSCDDLASCACGPNSIWICHIPPGNPAEAQTLCVGIPGALNGHRVTFDGLPGGHGGDYPGHCQGDATPSPSPTPSPSATSAGV